MAHTPSARAPSEAAAPASPRPDADRSPRARILRAFAERARRAGIRAVVLGDLAADLGMSKKTLYQHFESKDALVRALAEEAAARLRGAIDALARGELRGADLVRGWVERWTEGLVRFSPEFWRELERDYPDAFAVFDAVREDAATRARSRVGRDLRPGVHPEVARELFRLAVAHFQDHAVCERLGLARKDAVLAALEIWIGGALGAPSEA